MLGLKPGQTDSQVDTSLQNQNLRWVAKRIRSPQSRLASSRKLQKSCRFPRIYSSLAINLCRLVLGGQTLETCVDLRPKLSSNKVVASQRKWVAKRNAICNERKSKTCVRLASPFCQAIPEVRFH